MNSLLQPSRMKAGHILPGVLLLFILSGCEDSARQAHLGEPSVPESSVSVTAQETGDTENIPETDELAPELTAVDTQESVSTTGDIPALEPAGTIAQPEQAAAESVEPEVAAEPAVLQPKVAVEVPFETATPGLAPEPVTEPEPAPSTVVEPPTPSTITTTPDARSARQAPPLDLDSLETRLRKTKAIGVFTKLELKGQVEDLVKEVDLYHRSKGKLSLEQLEDHFDLLVMKLLILVQDGDPALSKEIANARPTLWTALADPVQFSSIKGP